jgi:hypothetical protein
MCRNCLIIWKFENLKIIFLWCPNDWHAKWSRHIGMITHRASCILSIRGSVPLPWKNYTSANVRTGIQLLVRFGAVMVLTMICVPIFTAMIFAQIIQAVLNCLITHRVPARRLCGTQRWTAFCVSSRIRIKWNDHNERELLILTKMVIWGGEFLCIVSTLMHKCVGLHPDENCKNYLPIPLV